VFFLPSNGWAGGETQTTESGVTVTSLKILSMSSWSIGDSPFQKPMRLVWTDSNFVGRMKICCCLNQMSILCTPLILAIFILLPTRKTTKALLLRLRGFVVTSRIYTGIFVCDSSLTGFGVPQF
jgi:hypothetical protein